MRNHSRESLLISALLRVRRRGVSGCEGIAGRSAPGSEVQIILNGEVLGRVTSDQRGQWVFLPPSPLVSGSHELSLRSKSASGALTESASPRISVAYFAATGARPATFSPTRQQNDCCPPCPSEALLTSGAITSSPTSTYTQRLTQ